MVHAKKSANCIQVAIASSASNSKRCCYIHASHRSNNGFEHFVRPTNENSIWTKINQQISTRNVIDIWECSSNGDPCHIHDHTQEKETINSSRLQIFDPISKRLLMCFGFFFFTTQTCYVVVYFAFCIFLIK